MQSNAVLEMMSSLYAYCTAPQPDKKRYNKKLSPWTLGFLMSFVYETSGAGQG